MWPKRRSAGDPKAAMQWWRQTGVRRAMVPGLGRGRIRRAFTNSILCSCKCYQNKCNFDSLLKKICSGSICSLHERGSRGSGCPGSSPALSAAPPCDDRHSAPANSAKGSCFARCCKTNYISRGIALQMLSSLARRFAPSVGIALCCTKHQGLRRAPQVTWYSCCHCDQLNVEDTANTHTRPTSAHTGRKAERQIQTEKPASCGPCQSCKNSFVSISGALYASMGCTAFHHLLMAMSRWALGESRPASIKVSWLKVEGASRKARALQ